MKRIAYWSLPLLMISALTTQGLAEAEQGQAQPSTEPPCLMLLNQQKYTESIAECHEALKLNPKDGFAWYWIGLSHKAALIDLAKKYNDVVKDYNDNRSVSSRNSPRPSMQSAEKLAENKKNETVDAFARAAAIGGEAGKQAHAELQKLFDGSPAELDNLIQDKKNQLRD